MIGVVNDVPEDMLEPPVTALYQLIVPALAVAPKVSVPAKQRLAGVVAVMVGNTFTVKVSVVALQPPVVVKVNVTLPADTAVITPELFIVATEGLELVQVPEPAGIAVVGAFVILG